MVIEMTRRRLVGSATVKLMQLFLTVVKVTRLAVLTPNRLVWNGTVIVRFVRTRGVEMARALDSGKNVPRRPFRCKVLMPSSVFRISVEQVFVIEL